ncbi:hypothetical protein NDN08_001780 [Rhodosorus marinus]|uniref:HIT-type domain-containing protein n=1 Tax=Rhodosorus marinus TaxID=101924 RepID=A0AAV8UW43_9RHOD|nr:hypothetical protein NDN08_001780 [Rhodosorus marinus]
MYVAEDLPRRLVNEEAVKGPKGRTRKLSKRVDVVDLARRDELRLQRLDALEKDNYVEEVQDVKDDEYDPLLDDDEAEPVKVSSKRRKTGRKRTEIIPQQGSKKPGIHRKNASLFELDLTEEWSANVPLYLSITAKPSRTPARAFCSVCGYCSKYKCTRCGSRYCSRKCLRVHSDTRCLKFLS